MATLKQIEANRRNALLSPGPKTPEGKAAVRLNALRHGLRAHTVVLPGEKSEQFQQLCDDLEAEWQPVTRTEQLYLEQMAVAQWKLRRMEIAEASLLEQKLRAHRQLPLLDRLWQAQCRMERSFSRAQHELQHIQKSRNQIPSIADHAPAADVDLELNVDAAPRPAAAIAYAAARNSETSSTVWDPEGAQSGPLAPPHELGTIAPLRAER